MDEKYLKPTAILDSDHPLVQQYARETVGDETVPVKKAVLLFNKVRDHIVYDPYTPFHRPTDYQASNLIERGRGYCVCKACLLCALGRAAGIPTRLGFATIRNQGATQAVIDMLGSDLFVYHGFAEFFLNGKWLKATPAFDQPVCDKHNIDLPRFDGEHDCIFPPENRAGEPYVDYVEDFGSDHDLPLDKLIQAWEKVYGRERMDLWIQALESPEGIESWRPRH
ncbi:transglutaminase-like domain-containing protein [Desulfatibacillum aliphaticivorans]|uniref:transglutaminase-like domain-containing protein n=1 Tax=Desulfatibacillum aliphaticivorans TaxID=218208 RepID=UPI000403ADA0|nr:transglutaminase-like domain-containing protein [Desulfatibacillum aliphaticivorans]